uniref:Protein kinase domain-containing protein n=1 Tax=Angiostrongylus cantonensis TaxID=6313 RepID=A0A158P7Q1_ANGCA
MAEGNNLVQLEPGKIIDKYTVTRKLGEGSFGAVYAVRTCSLAALKAESVNEKVPLLRLELIVMQRLQARNAVHMPDLIDKGRFEHFNYIVMKLLGKSLQEAKKSGPDQHLSLGPAIGCSIQCLEALEELHWAGFLHRDVKPGNFAVGRAETGDLRKLYILDFGMCRKYVDNKNVMLQPRKKAPFRGTPRYAPITSHNYKEHCRKDDIESWFYMLIDFTNAQLPWKGVMNIKDVGKYSARVSWLSCLLIGCMTTEKWLWYGCSHIDGLQFFDEPDYQMIYVTLRKAMSRNSVKEFPYDWEKFTQ